MAIIISTAQVKPCDQLDFWHDALHHIMIPCHYPATDHVGFKGWLQYLSLPSVNIMYATSGTPHSAMHSAPALAGSDDYYLATVVLSGGFVLYQDGHETRVERGAMAVQDTSLTYEFEDYGSKIRTLALRIPRDLLRQRISHADLLTIVRTAHSSELIDLFTNFVLRLLKTEGRFVPIITKQLEDQTLDLLAMALLHSIHGTGSELGIWSASAQLYRIKSFVEKHLQNPELSPAMVASALGISSSYIDKLWQGENTSLMRYVWTRRLEQCRQELCKPARSADDITRIAFRWGFSELSHFSRVFKARFGLSPRDYRHQNAHGACELEQRDFATLGCASQSN
jgi:AraC-like DNA-binding protein